MIPNQDRPQGGLLHRFLPHPASGKSLADLEKIIRDTLVEFETRGVEDDDLIKTKATMEAGFIFGLQSVSGKVSTLARHETFTGNPNYIEKDIARYASVTKADVMRVFNQYIKGKPAVIWPSSTTVEKVLRLFILPQNPETSSGCSVDNL